MVLASVQMGFGSTQTEPYYERIWEVAVATISEWRRHPA